MAIPLKIERRARTLRGAGALALAALMAHGARAVDTPVTTIDPPSPRGATRPALAVERPTSTDSEPELLMTWLEAGPRGGKLTFSRRSKTGWSAPVTIAEPVASLGLADPPSLVVIDTQGVRRTLLARTGDVVARSGDGGRTWSRLPAAAPLSFGSFAGGDEGAFAYWLATEGGGAAKLLGTRVLAGQTVLDPRVSEGVATAAAMTWDGPVVVYRDLHEDGARDLAIVRRERGRWLPPQQIAKEGATEIDDGPQIAVQKRLVAVAWTANNDHRSRLQVAFSQDAGRSFAPPVEVDSQNGERGPLGPVALTLDESGEAIVLWRGQRSSRESTIELARVAADGRRGAEIVLAQAPSASFLGLPQLARVGNEFAVAWVEGPLAHVRVVTVPLASIPPALVARSVPSPAPSRVKSGAGQGRVGDLAPLTLEGVDLAGRKVSLASLRGRAVVLNLWATWCAPCVAEMPELVSLEGRHGAKGLTVVGLNVDLASAVDKVRAFVAEKKLPFAIWLDPEMTFADALRVQGLPTTFVLDREGRIVLRRDQAIVGVSVDIEAAITKALAEP